jgi:hypothetical protein
MRMRSVENNRFARKNSQVENRLKYPNPNPTPNPIRLWILFNFVFFYVTRAFGSELTRTRIWLGKWIYSAVV